MYSDKIIMSVRGVEGFLLIDT